MKETKDYTWMYFIIMVIAIFISQHNTRKIMKEENKRIEMKIDSINKLNK